METNFVRVIDGVMVFYDVTTKRIVQFFVRKLTKELWGFSGTNYRNHLNEVREVKFNTKGTKSK